MANHRTANVIFADTTAAYAIPLTICGIKYKPGTQATTAVTIYGSGATSGSALWVEDNTSSNSFEEVEIRDNQGIAVVPAGGASVYIYLRVE